jgi:hypothetical protein
VLRLLVLTLILTLVPASASAQSLRQADPVVEQAGRALASDPLYVDPDAERALAADEADALRQRIEQSGQPVYIAVLPGAAGDAGSVLEQLVASTGRRGTYAVIVGDSFRAASNVLPRGTARRLANQAFQASSDGGPAAVLNDFVGRVAQARAGGGAAPLAPDPDGGVGRDGGGGAGLLGLLAIGALGFGAFSLVKSRQRRRAEQREIVELRDVADDELGALGEDMRAIELDVEMPDADPRAKGHMAEAVTAYDRANTALARARRPEHFEPIGNEIEHARWALAAARAVLEGRPEPERRPPCFFDPRHGPSVVDKMWSPDGGEPRPVPVCAADAQRLDHGELPESREIVLGGRRMPYWRAPGQFAPFYAGGMFGGFGGFAPGLLFGTMLGAPLFADALTPDVAFGDVGDIDPDQFGGDFGGGDFGGFGGGDFGGFGGGDF